MLLPKHLIVPDKTRIREALHTCFDSLSPYLDKQSKTILKKRIKELGEISDKAEFLGEAHIVYQKLLSAMRKRDMLMKEVPMALG